MFDIFNANCFIVDLDGTIADCTHRLHYVKEKPKHWGKFFAGVLEDEPIQDILMIVRSVISASGLYPIICTGRSEECREKTLAWINDKAFFGISNDRLYMRAEKDYRRDDITKKDMLDRLLADGHKPLFAIDDRQRVVDMYRTKNIRVLQVAKGDF